MKTEKIKSEIPMLKYDGICVFEKSGFIYVVWVRAKWQDDENGRSEVLDYRNKRFPVRWSAKAIINQINKES